MEKGDQRVIQVSFAELNASEPLMRYRNEISDYIKTTGSILLVGQLLRATCLLVTGCTV